MHSSSSAPARRDTLIARTGLLYFPLALVARLPFAMGVVGVLTLLVSVRGSVEIAGLGSAMVGIASAMFGPLVGAAADRYGQRPTLLAAACVNSAALGLLAWVAYSPLPSPAVFASAFLVGASVPQTSPMSRSRLVTIVQRELPAARRPRTISTVLAYESAADEIIFVFGPVIVGLLATTMGAWAPIAGAAALTLVFVTAFALHRTGVDAKSPEERAATLAPASELARPSLLVVVVGIFAVGMVFGTTLTSLTAFMQARGAAESAGLFYGVMGVGSAILAISVALFSPRFTLRYRWLVFALCIVAGEAILSSAGRAGSGVGIVAAGLAVTGVGIGPLLVTLYGFGSARSPEGRSATVMTMLGSGIMLGQSLAAAVTGAVAEELGAGAAMVLPLCAGLVVVLAGLINWLLTPRGAR
ncbi:MFS transporter [Leucobacter sp. wl10]|uniref:MFS transporter n=1 Tax=Leucobacter sp. wl10 TaxID=2304677 RepID=UPI000E5BECC0|nr:MFS transporter [Leucobacter sp. wl10]RGE21033.1 MFS transporter [Leucobacter sp. wl10]